MDHLQIEQGVRLKKLIKTLKFNQLSFAKSLGMTQPNISRMATGEGKISVEVLNRIIDTYKNVNMHWLLTGEGEMFMDSQEDKIRQVEEPPGTYAAKGKGRLEDLEERVERLEEAVRGLKENIKRK